MPATGESAPAGSRRAATLITLMGSSANTLLVSLQAVLLIPLYTHYVGPKLYGAWLGSGDVLVWLQAFDLGLPNLMIQRVASAHGRGDHKTVAEWFASSMFALALIGCVIAAGGLLISRHIATFLAVKGPAAAQLQTCFAIAALVTGVLIVNNGLVGFSRAVQRTGLTNIVTIVAGLSGLFASLWLILHGSGLLAIPLGMVVRALATLIGSAWFSISFLTSDFRPHLRVRAQVLREVLLVSPATAFGTLGYAVMNQSETVLAATMFGPELAIILNLTKKSADVFRSLIDMIGFASYGGFAHLVSSPERRKALLIHSDITSLRLSAAILAAVLYMCTNPLLVSMWVGSQYYGGSLLTIVVGLHLVVVGGSYLTNYLYRASGQIVRGSLMLIAESFVRIPLMVLFSRWFQMPGLLVGGIVTASVSMTLVQRWTNKQLSLFAETAIPASPRVWAMRAAVFAMGAMVCAFLPTGCLALTLSVAVIAVTVGGAALVYTDKPLSHTLAMSLV
jgi:O-antigen/teichoic acid export membrane protein